MLFFFKQKTAYELRISDWSSDVCSSDLPDRDLANIRSTGAGRIFVLERNSRLVAAAVAGRDGWRGWIYYVAVAPDCQGEGLGRRIVEHAEAWLKSDRKSTRLNSSH